MTSDGEKEEGGTHPAQTIDYPGRTGDMAEQPRDEMAGWVGRGLLDGRRALITGGDSGIGRAVAAIFAKEGADVVISYLDGTRTPGTPRISFAGPGAAPSPWPATWPTLGTVRPW